jgi:hypothetical protein
MQIADSKGIFVVDIDNYKEIALRVETGCL